MIPCANRMCFRQTSSGSLCGSCQDKREAALIMCVCLFMSGLIIVAAKVGHLL